MYVSHFCRENRETNTHTHCRLQIGWFVEVLLIDLCLAFTPELLRPGSRFTNQFEGSTCHIGIMTNNSKLQTQMLHGAGVFANIYPKNHRNVGKYTIHGSYGPVLFRMLGFWLCPVANHEKLIGRKCRCLWMANPDFQRNGSVALPLASAGVGGYAIYIYI